MEHTHGTALLGEMQGLLERIYDVETAHKVHDFLITDPVLARALENAPEPRQAQEKLLVAQQDDSIDLALYLDRDVLDHLIREDPIELLHHGNLAEFWTALEGVSHFVYLAWNAGFERRVTLLEMEMQAEVDKFVAAMFLLGSQKGGRLPSRLHELLFARPSFCADLAAEDLERYRRANRYAGKYCQQLGEMFVAVAGRDGLMSELRRFYRLPQRAKMRRIDAAAQD